MPQTKILQIAQYISYEYNLGTNECASSSTFYNFWNNSIWIRESMFFAEFSEFNFFRKSGLDREKTPQTKNSTDRSIYKLKIQSWYE